MAEEDLKKLLAAEKEAERKVSEARARAREILETAEIEARKERETILSDFERKREEELRKVEERSNSEAERIRVEGRSIAGNLRKKAHTRIPTAVERVLEAIREDRQQSGWHDIVSRKDGMGGDIPHEGGPAQGHNRTSGSQVDPSYEYIGIKGYEIESIFAGAQSEVGSNIGSDRPDGGSRQGIEGFDREEDTFLCSRGQQPQGRRFMAGIHRGQTGTL